MIPTIPVKIKAADGEKLGFLFADYIVMVEGCDGQKCRVHMLDRSIWDVLMPAEELIKKFRELEGQ